MPQIMYQKLENDAGVILHPAAIQALVADEGGSWSFETARVAAARLSRGLGVPIVLHRRKLAQFRGHAGGEKHQDRVVVLDLDAELRVCQVCGSYFVDQEGSCGDSCCYECLSKSTESRSGSH